MKHWENELHKGGLRLNLNVEHMTRHRSTSVTHLSTAQSCFRISYSMRCYRCIVKVLLRSFNAVNYVYRFHILLAHKNSNHHVEDNSEAQGSGTYAQWQHIKYVYTYIKNAATYY